MAVGAQASRAFPNPLLQASLWPLAGVLGLGVLEAVQRCIGFLAQHLRWTPCHWAVLSKLPDDGQGPAAWAVPVSGAVDRTCEAPGTTSHGGRDVGGRPWTRLCLSCCLGEGCAEMSGEPQSPNDSACLTLGSRVVRVSCSCGCDCRRNVCESWGRDPTFEGPGGVASHPSGSWVRTEPRSFRHPARGL